MDLPEERWNRQIDGLRRGDELIVGEFWDQYGPLLLKVAENNLAENLRRRVGPEDVVQSACRTFLRRAKGGQFQLEGTEGLWRLLCAITLTKIREQARYHRRHKRSMDQETNVDAADVSGGGLTASGPTPQEAAEFAEQYQKLLADLDPEEREMLELKLQDMTQEEIAARLGCTDRTVRRILKRLQSRLEGMFGMS